MDEAQRFIDPITCYGLAMTKEHDCNNCNDTTCDARDKREGEQDEDYRDRQLLLSRMCRIQHKILILSGKGGVGKSTVAVNLATSLALAGKRVGLLDVDIHGPSVPKLLNLESATVTSSEGSLSPVTVSFGEGSLNVMSIGFLLRDKDDAIIWRGPRKFGAIKQFLKDVEWGELDYLVIDSPPGTGDEPLAVAQLIENADGAIVVTTPQQVAVQDVRRCIVFCRQLKLPVIGVVENMSGFVCPKCNELYPIFGADGGLKMAEEMGVPYLGPIPIEPDVVTSGDNGQPMVQSKPHSETAKAFGRMVRSLLAPTLERADPGLLAPAAGSPIRIAVPITSGILASHFGHCEQFVLIDVANDAKTITGQNVVTPPPHEPGSFPRWLHEQGANLIIAGGMGSRAQSLFEQNNIKVIVGAANKEPQALVQDYLRGKLTTVANICDH
jgi:Mrp family chromosome partitioning ATPase/predicted Fe-Mo cluster-binding NifX family protein